MPFIRTHFTAL